MANSGLTNSPLNGDGGVVMHVDERVWGSIKDVTRGQPKIRQLTEGQPSNLVSARQLRAARNMANLTQVQLSLEAGFHRDAIRWHESHGDEIPTTNQASLARIEEALARHGVVLISEPHVGCLYMPHQAAAR